MSLKGSMAKKSMTDAEKALAQSAKEFKEAAKMADWGQKEHCLFIARVAHDCGMPQERLLEFHAKLGLLGLGGNCSQFAQSVGFRQPAAAAPDGAALLAKLGLA